MEIRFIFNHQYDMATGHYHKIGGVVSTDDGKIHVFSVVKNLGTGAIERQKFVDVTKSKVTKLMTGTVRGSSYYEPCNPAHKADFLPLVYHLSTAFLRLHSAVGFSPDDYTRIREAINRQIADLKNEAPASAPSEEFTDIPAAKMDDDLVNRILSETAGEIGKITEIEGVKYRLGKVGEDIRLQWNKPAEITETAAPETAESVRHFIQMAKIVNAEGLQGVVNGNFYPLIKDNVQFGDKHFVTINVDGGEKSLLKERVKIVSVYADTL